MKLLSSAPGIKSDAAYPTGYRLDPSVTKVSTTINQDIITFFQKLISLAGITANGNFDNDTNGYQSIAALKAYHTKEINAVPAGGNGIVDINVTLSGIEAIDTYVYESATLATITAPATCSVQTLFNANSVCNSGVNDAPSNTSLSITVQISNNGTDWASVLEHSTNIYIATGQYNQLIIPTSYAATIAAGATLYIRLKYSIPLTYMAEFQYVTIEGILHSRINTIGIIS